MNYWTDHSKELAPAYARAAGPVTFELALRAILPLLPTRQKGEGGLVADIGGGCGQLAIALAHQGHQTDIVDIDTEMLGYAEALLGSQPDEIQKRIRLFHGDGTSAANILRRRYDVVVCHSVIMYEPALPKLVSALCSLVKPGGYVSVIAVNPDSLAMRAGLLQNWVEALEIMQTGKQRAERYRPTENHRWPDLLGEIEKMGGVYHQRYGIGIFADHLDAIARDELDDIIKLEWRAGEVDPYRDVARCYHLIGHFPNGAKSQ